MAKYIWYLAMGPFCVLFCPISWGTEKVHLATTKWGRKHNCKSEWSMSLDLKEAGTTKGGKRPVPWGLQANLILPIPLKNRLRGGTLWQWRRGSLRAEKQMGKTQLLRTAHKPEVKLKAHGWPASNWLTPTSKFLSLSVTVIKCTYQFEDCKGGILPDSWQSILLKHR